MRLFVLGAIIGALCSTVSAAGPTSRAAGIAVLISSGMAPCTVHVQATDIPFVSGGTPVTTRYQWDFGDPAGTNNALRGFNAAHVYNKEGKYSITLTLPEPNTPPRT